VKHVDGLAPLSVSSGEEQASNKGTGLKSDVAANGAPALERKMVPLSVREEAATKKGRPMKKRKTASASSMKEGSASETEGNDATAQKKERKRGEKISASDFFKLMESEGSLPAGMKESGLMTTEDFLKRVEGEKKATTIDSTAIAPGSNKQAVKTETAAGGKTSEAVEEGQVMNSLRRKPTFEPTMSHAPTRKPTQQYGVQWVLSYYYGDFDDVTSANCNDICSHWSSADCMEGQFPTTFVEFYNIWNQAVISNWGTQLDDGDDYYNGRYAITDQCDYIYSYAFTYNSNTYPGPQVRYDLIFFSSIYNQSLTQLITCQSSCVYLYAVPTHTHPAAPTMPFLHDGSLPLLTIVPPTFYCCYHLQKIVYTTSAGASYYTCYIGNGAGTCSSSIFAYYASTTTTNSHPVYDDVGAIVAYYDDIYTSWEKWLGYGVCPCISKPTNAPTAEPTAKPTTFKPTPRPTPRPTATSAVRWVYSTTTGAIDIFH
jgi:hypothetical protein